MKKLGTIAVGVATALAMFTVNAHALTVTLGEQDFFDGDMPGLSSFASASLGEDAPFDQFYGSDPYGPNFSKDFTFSYVDQAVLSASLTFGIYDADGDADGIQLASFTLDGIDLTADLSPFIETANHVTVSVITLALPASTYAALSDGSATFSLALQGPSLLGNPTLPYNGAGLDFATLNMRMGQAVPEAASCGVLLAMSMVAMAGLRRKFS